MKVGILTITGGENFGNRLQNFALQTIIEQYSEQADTIKNFTRAEDNYKMSFKIKKCIKQMSSVLYYILPVKNNATINLWHRQYVFEKFNKRNIKFSKYRIDKDNIADGITQYYDYFISGSDQVWNPHYLFNSHIEFMDFAERGQRISYAASFGVSEIPDKKKALYSEWLDGIDNISVREEQGKNIIRELTGKEAKVLVDPTLLLDSKQWTNIAKKPHWLKHKKYIVTYFLGDKSNEIQDSVKEISSNYQLPVISLNDITMKKEYSTSPEEFIYLIHNCELLCTDSFHGTIFAYQMNKPVLIYERKLISGEVQMNSRMQMIEQLLSVGDRVAEKVDINNEKQLFHCDYSEAAEKINREREKAHDFIRNSIGV